LRVLIFIVYIFAGTAEITFRPTFRILFLARAFAFFRAEPSEGDMVRGILTAVPRAWRAFFLLGHVLAIDSMVPLIARFWRSLRPFNVTDEVKC